MKNGAQRLSRTARGLINGCDFQLPHGCHTLIDGTRRRLSRSRGRWDQSEWFNVAAVSPTQTSPLLFPTWCHRGASSRSAVLHLVLPWHLARSDPGDGSGDSTCCVVACYLLRGWAQENVLRMCKGQVNHGVRNELRSVTPAHQVPCDLPPFPKQRGQR